MQTQGVAATGHSYIVYNREIQSWLTGSFCDFHQVSRYVSYRDSSIAIRIVSWGYRIVTPLVCNTVRLGQDTTWNRRVHGLRVYPVCVCNTVRLELSRMDSVTIKPSHSIRCVYRADLILLQIVDWSSKEVCPTILINKSEDNLH